MFGRCKEHKKKPSKLRSDYSRGVTTGLFRIGSLATSSLCVSGLGHRFGYFFFPSSTWQRETGAAVTIVHKPPRDPLRSALPADRNLPLQFPLLLLQFRAETFRCPVSPIYNTTPRCLTLGEPHTDPPRAPLPPHTPLGTTPSNLVRLQQLLLLQVPTIHSHPQLPHTITNVARRLL